MNKVWTCWHLPGLTLFSCWLTICILWRTSKIWTDYLHQTIQHWFVKGKHAEYNLRPTCYFLFLFSLLWGLRACCNIKLNISLQNALIRNVACIQRTNATFWQHISPPTFQDYQSTPFWYSMVFSNFQVTRKYCECIDHHTFGFDPFLPLKKVYLNCENEPGSLPEQWHTVKEGASAAVWTSKRI